MSTILETIFGIVDHKNIHTYLRVVTDPHRDFHR